MVSSSEVRVETHRAARLAETIEPFNAGPLSVSPLSGGFGAKARASRLGDLALFRVRMREGRVVSPPNPSLSLSIPLVGRVDVTGGAERMEYGPGTCLVRDDDSLLDCVVPDSEVFVAVFDEGLLRETAGRLAGGDAAQPVRAEPRLSLTSPKGVELWRRLSAAFRAVEGDESWLQSLEAVAEERSALAAALIDALAAPGPERNPVCGLADVRRAEEFILGHLKGPVSRADLCAAAGLTERSLSRGFRRHHGVGPMTFLRQRRLDAARRLLLAAEPGERSVTDIALECGLHHLGRFSVEYRRTFGESPAETLRG